MNAYVIVVDVIYEVVGKQDDDNLIVTKGPRDSGLSGSIFHKFSWATTKDYAYILLEMSLKKALDQWKVYAEFYKNEHRTSEEKQAREQIPIFEDLLRRCRLYDNSFIRRLD